MTRLRRIAGLTTAAALTLALTACGDGSDYCDQIEGVRDDFSDFTGTELPDMETLTDAQATIADVAETAPDDIQEQWQNLADGVQVIIDAGGDPSSVDAEDAAGFATIQEDIEAIEAQVQEECDIDMNEL